jgi:hypothetical protein
MFDYVPRKDLDVERERRIRAEAEVENAREEVATVNSRLAEMTALLGAERERHRQEMTDLLDRLLPKPKDPVPGFGVPSALGGPSYEDIIRTPAVGKRGVRERNAAARDAKAREDTENAEATVGNQRAALLPEEAAMLDQQIIS